MNEGSGTAHREENRSVSKVYTEWMNVESGTAHREENRSVSHVYTKWMNAESGTAHREENRPVSHVYTEWMNIRVWDSWQRGEPLSFACLHKVNEWTVWDSQARRTAQFCTFTQSEWMKSLGQPTARRAAQFRKFTQPEWIMSPCLPAVQTGTHVNIRHEQDKLWGDVASRGVGF